MYSLEEVKVRSARANPEANNKLHFFASKLSIYFSWIFVNLRLSANQVTVVFFLMGLTGSVCFVCGPEFYLLGYIFWRLHIIFDLCDGDVARFNQTFSINGAYWDYMIHSVLYPLVYISICYSLYDKFNDFIFLLVGLLGSLVVSQLLAVKNNYYRAMLFSKKSLDMKQSSVS